MSHITNDDIMEGLNEIYQNKPHSEIWAELPEDLKNAIEFNWKDDTDLLQEKAYEVFLDWKFSQLPEVQND